MNRSSFEISGFVLVEVMVEQGHLKVGVDSR